MYVKLCWTVNKQHCGNLLSKIGSGWTQWIEVVKQSIRLKHFGCLNVFAIVMQVFVTQLLLRMAAKMSKSYAVNCIENGKIVCREVEDRLLLIGKNELFLNA